ncbi:hypothetical protein GLAREA_04282 [Glarea lozoyensis ATCC 20868]|uniref:Uncharacterized protein n=1 Tax=Glarea lozoyensis (strain ATCC 20868 / MF5171) TaxID=1116229 RepID=S3D5X5_GLAL2|nr:uncharacterized protein GLAREA_04282 [Glarea lozoyensis ATCC 20868]EPE27491.1 hypothetical protein GLAREA_04282 [Glarea lozoyensis ATCC 20868]
MASNDTSSLMLRGWTFVAVSVAVVSVIDRLAIKSDGTSRSQNDNREILGPWISKQAWGFFGAPSVLYGPPVTAKLSAGYKGQNEVYLARIPHGLTGSSGWSTLMNVIRPEPFLFLENGSATSDSLSIKAKAGISWDAMADTPLGPLTYHEGKYCVKISRATLMSLFTLTNARPIFSYSSAAGYRSAYPSYGGQWSISWPIGRPCIVSLAPHDSHTAETDVYPPVFPVRLDKCVEMLAGIISAPDGWKLAFPGRVKEKGSWRLCEIKKGFPGAHGSRHLYNMMGGKVFEVDLLVLQKLHADFKEPLRKIQVRTVSSPTETSDIHIFEHEDNLLAHALDCLPWTSLSWSMHRGMRDILVAYGKSVMDQYRTAFAAFLQQNVVNVETTLMRKGWNKEFIHSSMGDMAQSSVLSGGGNSGDLVRIVVGIVDAILEMSGPGTDTVNKDETKFWRKAVLNKKQNELLKWDLSNQEFVGLAKFFVLEWSQELDYQLYHELPVDLYLA